MLAISSPSFSSVSAGVIGGRKPPVGRARGAATNSFPLAILEVAAGGTDASFSAAPTSEAVLAAAVLSAAGAAEEAASFAVPPQPARRLTAMAAAVAIAAILLFILFSSLNRSLWDYHCVRTICRTLYQVYTERPQKRKYPFP